MTQEDKELLLTVLCTMLRYGVKVTTTNPAVEFGIISGISIKDKISVSTKDADIIFECAEVTPYLRPMSSMTEKEVVEFEKICKFKCYPKHLRGAFFDNDCTPFSTGDVDDEYRYINTEDVIKCIDWLNAHHFDYRGLIQKGLAIEAPEGMYN